MRLVCLPAAARDLPWLRHYCERVFPEGAAGARVRIRAMERRLLDNPHVGRPTPERIEILRVFDGRSFEAGLED